MESKHYLDDCDIFEILYYTGHLLNLYLVLLGYFRLSHQRGLGNDWGMVETSTERRSYVGLAWTRKRWRSGSYFKSGQKICFIHTYIDTYRGMYIYIYTCIHIYDAVSSAPILELSLGLPTSLTSGFSQSR